MNVGIPALVLSCLLAGCPKSVGVLDSGPPAPDAASDLPIRDGMLGAAFCDLPGSLVYAASGTYMTAGSQSAPDLSWLHVPTGFCVHYFAHVPNARQVRFAPGGELFVTSPTTVTTGGGFGGFASIVVVPDDDHDGYGDQTLHFLDGLPSTQGILFTGGYLYYQDGTRIRRVAYHAGDRTGSAPGELVAEITGYSSPLHWPKTLDVADDGTIYVGNGGDQSETCDTSKPFHGGILKLDGRLGGTPVSRGLRNPIAIRCQRGHDRCYALELARDYSGDQHGREKMLPVRAGDDWGYNCCATKDLPYDPSAVPSNFCASVTPEDNAFLIGSTPFGLDFDYGAWPSPWTRDVLVALHGAFGTWVGARVVAILTDPSTGAPLPSSDLSGAPSGAMSDFATGWDDGSRAHGRPAAVVMADDGRLFVANDVNGDIVWIAPITAGSH
jgi:glucose/arabinose dehydrogenase